MIEFVQGDIFDHPVDIRVNTVNCVGVMGAGVALAFKKRYPEMFNDYRNACKSGMIRPGRMHVWKSLDGVWVINFPTKRDWREPSRYEDIDIGLDDLRQYLDSVGPVSVALPALGCGHGGLDWRRVSSMIQHKLDGVNAHVYVFEPSASRRAGKHVVSEVKDERLFSKQLGYDLIESGHFFGTNISKPVYVKGPHESLLKKWIALLPSRNPGERELHALKLIAKELGKRETHYGVALVYGTKSTEEVADIFTMQGVRTVLLLPFGVLAKKNLGKKPLVDKSNALTIVSMAEGEAGWSRQLLARNMDALRMNAGAVILSDPDPAWISEKELDRWKNSPISFVKYDAVASSWRNILESTGAKPIGRRGEHGAPNIDFVLAAFNGVASEPRNLVDAGATGVSAPTNKAIEDDNRRHTGGDVLKVNINAMSDETLRYFLDLVVKTGINEISVTIPSYFSKADRQRLLELVGVRPC